MEQRVRRGQGYRPTFKLYVQPDTRDEYGNPGLPLSIQLLMDHQVNRVIEDASDDYSHTGNSWNQSDIDEAYRNYYSQMPM